MSEPSRSGAAAPEKKTVSYHLPALAVRYIERESKRTRHSKSRVVEDIIVYYKRQVKGAV